MPSTATWYRIPKLGSQSARYWWCQPLVMGVPSRNSETTRSSSNTPIVNQRSTPLACRGKNSSAAAPTNGRNTIALSRWRHSAGTSAPEVAGDHNPITNANASTAIIPSAMRSNLPWRAGMTEPTPNASTYGIISKIAFPSGFTAVSLALVRLGSALHLADYVAHLLEAAQGPQLPSVDARPLGRFHFRRDRRRSS